MRKWASIVAVTALAIFAIVDTIHDFVANDTVHYFAEQPRRLLMVACIGIAGGFVAIAFERMPRRLHRILKLCAWGSAASLLTIFSGYFLFESVALFSQLRAAETL